MEVVIVCLLFLFAYVFDIFSSKIRMPTVIVLLLTGWLVQMAVGSLEVRMPDLNPLLKPMGTLGLILIVLEGALELELKKEKIPIVLKSGLGSLFSIVVVVFLLSFSLVYLCEADWHTALFNSIPLSIISSAIAIPSVRGFHRDTKEFVTYESSISDILGVVFFTYVSTETVFRVSLFGIFVFHLLLMLVVSLGFSLLLAFLMTKIKHKVKFLPIVIFVIMIYYIAKEMHLPALIFILIFGLFLSNIQRLETIFPFLKVFRLSDLDMEIDRFNDIVVEITFLVRVIFFMLFGFLLSTDEIINLQSLWWSLPIVGVIYLTRFLQLKIFKMKISSLLYIAPRGLITILLFLSIPEANSLWAIDRSVIVQVILLTSFFIMFASFKRRGSLI